MFRETTFCQSIFVAVVNNKETARQQLGDELTEKLSDVCYEQFCTLSDGVMHGEYDELREILQFKTRLA